MKKVLDIIEPFVETWETCEEVKRYFDKNTPTGPYYALTQFFQGDKTAASKSDPDQAYKEWLEGLLEDGREADSIVLTALKRHYGEKKLADFVFLQGEKNPEYNQKWHFFISYWGYREFVTKYPEKNNKLKPFQNGDEASDGNPFQRCTEGKIWYESARTRIRQAGSEDAKALARLAMQLWTGHELDELTQAFRDLLRNKEAACFLKYDGGRPIGFAQCQLRHDYVAGTDSSPVGYLEGIFVAEGFRKKGYAAQLLARCEQWAKEKKCTEFASDCKLDNADSLKLHTIIQ